LVLCQVLFRRKNDENVRALQIASTKFVANISPEEELNILSLLAKFGT